MKAEVKTYGGNKLPDTNETYAVKHWQLFIDNQFVADTSVPQRAELFEKIVAEINKAGD